MPYHEHFNRMRFVRNGMQQIGCSKPIFLFFPTHTIMQSGLVRTFPVLVMIYLKILPIFVHVYRFKMYSLEVVLWGKRCFPVILSLYRNRN